MSYTQLSDSTPIARKNHHCSWCGERIESGSMYMRTAGINDGDFQVGKFHPECDAAATDEFRRDPGFEYLPYDNERPERVEPRDYYVISVHHTRREDRYILLWRPDNKGYTYRASTAGRYSAETIRAHLGYYNCGCSNIAVPTGILDALTVMTTPADQFDGADGPAILNTRAKWRILLANVIEPTKYKPEPMFNRAPLTDWERRELGYT
ncbi:hypothetical protein BN2476_830041 [Paraburkholderia piptadeniae]|uniref:Uncharacterized protein n=1 Tax=Paraburkholderia piptadeniae TaxID=1701573 RepID=A0A1N7ST12_9BURK|nr:hypothetical protein [Paraburkholderia piptadeniae]SIT50470.1 hypothetical protein BN2476_830041 [Paraburkholderia piptadeniae]